jgi:hypothetical protein
MEHQTKQNRSVSLATRFTEAERNTLTQAAEAAGVSMSDLVRSAVLQQPLPPSKPRRATRPTIQDGDKFALLLSAAGRIGNNVNQLAYVGNRGGWPETEELQQAVSDIRWMRNTLMQALGVYDQQAEAAPHHALER